MKKRTVSLLLVLLCAACLCTFILPAAAEDGTYIYETTGRLLEQSEWQTLNDAAAELSQRYSCGVYIAVVEDYADYGNSVEKAAENIYQGNNFGLYNDSSGILLLLSMKDRDYDIYSHGFGTYATSGNGKARLEDAMLDNFRYDDWYGGFRDYINGCGTLLEAGYQAYSSGETNQGPEFAFCLIIGILVGCAAGGIVCAINRSKMKSVAKATTARFYAVPGGMNLYETGDVFSHITESRVKIESDSDRGGGSRPSGGGSHSSGKF